MALNTSEMRSNGVKAFFFTKNYEKSPTGWGRNPETPTASGGWGLRSKTPVNNTFELQYTSSLNTSPNLDIFIS